MSNDSWLEPESIPVGRPPIYLPFHAWPCSRHGRHPENIGSWADGCLVFSDLGGSKGRELWPAPAWDGRPPRIYAKVTQIFAPMYGLLSRGRVTRARRVLPTAWDEHGVPHATARAKWVLS